MPRWNFDKFKGADDTLGLQMKSVGEVMSIGRTFPEALQKACQSLENNAIGLSSISSGKLKVEELLEYIKRPTWDRIFKLKEAIQAGISIKTIREATHIDRWFLYQIQDIVKMENKIKEYPHLEKLPVDVLREAKIMGFSDEQIAELVKDCTSEEVYEHRKKENIKRVYKMVDTCSAEFAASTPYYYSSFETSAISPESVGDLPYNESIVSDRKKIIVLGSGPNRIGQGIEFDYCCTHGLLAAKNAVTKPSW